MMGRKLLRRVLRGVAEQEEEDWGEPSRLGYWCTKVLQLNARNSLFRQELGTGQASAFGIEI